MATQILSLQSESDMKISPSATSTLVFPTGPVTTSTSSRESGMMYTFPEASTSALGIPPSEDEDHRTEAEKTASEIKIIR